MFNTIIQKLPNIEQQYQIKLLFVAESGSRAWGFSSSDSDYDVRGIFIHPKTAYLAIDAPLETLEWIENDWFDVGAWDLTKTLRLLRKSNAVLLEWLQSPIIYQQYPSIQAELIRLAQQYYQPKAVLYHYRGIAKTVSATMDIHAVKLKKWFYLLRALLAAYWVTQCDQIPPMQLIELLSPLSESHQQEIQQLVAFKADKDEHFLWQPSQSMQQLIADLWQQTDITLETLEIPNSQLLNHWFRKVLDEINP